MGCFGTRTGAKAGGLLTVTSGSCTGAGHLEMVHTANKEWKGPLLLGIDLSHLWDFIMRRGSSDLESMKAVGHQVQEIQYGAGSNSVSHCQLLLGGGRRSVSQLLGQVFMV